MAKIMNAKIDKHILSELDNDRKVLAVENHTLGSKKDLIDQIELLAQAGYIRATMIKNYMQSNVGYSDAIADEITPSGRRYLATL